jgi:3-oxoacyl-[acyl-carrier-protein] synthase II
MRRVVVTGIGLVTPLGIGTEETWDALLAGRSAVGPIQGYDTSSFRTHLAGEVSGFDPEQWASRKTLRTMTRNDQLALAGASLARDDATPDEGADGERGGLWAGSSKEVSNLPPILDAVLVARNDDGSLDLRRLGAEASSAFYPLFYVEGLQAASLFYISQAFGLKGPNTYFSGTGEVGAMAVGRAFRAIRRGEADSALAGAFDDASSWWNMMKFDPFGILSGRNDLGSGACRPYDAERDGTVLGEGSAFLHLESEDAARERGARIYAEITGFGSAFDAGALLTPDPEGTATELAAKAALTDASAAAAGVDFVAADGTGTRSGDASEASALRRLFGGDARPAATSIAPATGHLLGGAGALNIAVAALALHHGRLPPTLNLRNVDPECDFAWVRDQAQERTIDQALALARGLEGQSAALVLRSARDR